MADDESCVALHLDAHGEIVDCPGYPHARNVVAVDAHEPERGDVVGACAVCGGPIVVELKGAELHHAYGDIPVIVETAPSGRIND